MGKFLVLFAAFCFVSAAAFAQEATGRVVGTITDPTGAVVPNAKITVTNVDTQISRETTTEADGSYQVPALPIGRYTVSAEAPGFRKIVTAAQPLEINQAQRVDIRLEVGSSSETVQVQSNATNVETVTATLGSAVTTSFINDLPLNGRDTLGLALMAPGVIPSTSGGAGSFSIGGERQDSVTYLLDGGINNDLLSNGVVLDPNPDTVEEFRVLTSNYSAEYGRNAGGIVSVVTKSGTNSYHGSAYDYLRNDDFDANPFFNNANGIPKAILKRNQFGATLGGPISIPKLIHGKDRFFFFVAWQSQRQVQSAQTSLVTVFTPAELTGDFSHANASGTGPDPKVVKFLQAHPYFQSNATLASEGIIDPTKISSVAQAYIKAGLIPSSPTGSLLSQSNSTDNRDELTEKLDFLVTPTDRISATLGSNRRNVLSPYATANVNGYPNTTKTDNYYGSVDYTKTFRPTLLNDFRFTAQRTESLQAVPAASLPTPSQLGIGITPDNATGPPILSFASGLIVGFSPQGPSTLIDNTYTWSDDVTWIKGAHTFKTGFLYTPYQDNQVFDFYVNGEFSFYGTAGGNYSQNDFADFLMGLPDELFQAPAAPSNIRTFNFGAYFQDEWKARKNLTLTLGIRWEHNSPKYDTQGRTFSAILGDQSTRFPNAPEGLVFPGDAGAPRGANFPEYHDWAPRFGFAWDPKSDNKTSIRGGWGMFYDILKAEDNFQFNGQEPFFSSADLLFNPLTGNPTSAPTNFNAPFATVGRPNPFPSTPPSPNLNFITAGFIPFGGAGVYFVSPNLKTPYIYDYNLSVQREVLKNTVLEVSYIGSDSHGLTGLIDSDPFVPGSTKRIFNTQPGLVGLPCTSSINCAFSYLPTFANVGKAHYNSLVVGLSRRPTELGLLGRVGLTANYTHGRSIDNESGFRSSWSTVPYFQHDLFMAVSNFDLPNYFNFTADWELPFYKASFLPGRLTKGWFLRPILSYRDGLPLIITSRLSRSVTKPGPSGVGDQELVMANYLGGLTEYNPEIVQTAGSGLTGSSGKTGNFYFNPNSFAPVPSSGIPGQFTYGTLGRNAFRGPDNINLDVSLAKSIALWNEKSNLEFRSDFFDVFNHAEFGNPSTTITSPTFGQISTTLANRIIQLALRLQF
jgi:outer membrane receptor protein involved in Fe transport